jgi:hypothetical protein
MWGRARGLSASVDRGIGEVTRTSSGSSAGSPRSAYSDSPADSPRGTPPGSPTRPPPAAPVHAMPKCFECVSAEGGTGAVEVFAKNGVLQCVVPGAWLVSGAAALYLWPVIADPAPHIIYQPARLDRVLVGCMWPARRDSTHAVCAVGVVCGMAVGRGAEALVPVEIGVAMHATLQPRRVYAVPITMLARMRSEANVELVRAVRVYNPVMATVISAHPDPPRPDSPRRWVRGAADA